MRGDKSFRHGGCRGPVQVRRNLGERVFRDHDVFGLRAAGCNAEDALARLPGVHILANLVHFAREFKSGNILRHAWRRGITTLALQNVRPIQRRGTDAHANAIGCRARGHFNFADLETFNASVGNNRCCFHECMVNEKWRIENGSEEQVLVHFSKTGFSLECGDLSPLLPALA